MRDIRALLKPLFCCSPLQISPPKIVLLWEMKEREMGLVYFGKGPPPFGRRIHFEMCLATAYKGTETDRKKSNDIFPYILKEISRKNIFCALHACAIFCFISFCRHKPFLVMETTDRKACYCFLTKGNKTLRIVTVEETKCS